MILILFIKKIMQKDNVKVKKISIFNFLNIKFKFLMNQVKLSHVKLKMCVIQL